MELYNCSCIQTPSLGNILHSKPLTFCGYEGSFEDCENDVSAVISCSFFFVQTKKYQCFLED